MAKHLANALEVDNGLMMDGVTAATARQRHDEARTPMTGMARRFWLVGAWRLPSKIVY
jgi:hypothetical protein